MLKINWICFVSLPRCQVLKELYWQFRNLWTKVIAVSASSRQPGSSGYPGCCWIINAIKRGKVTFVTKGKPNYLTLLKILLGLFSFFYSQKTPNWNKIVNCHRLGGKLNLSEHLRTRSFLYTIYWQIDSIKVDTFLYFWKTIHCLWIGKLLFIERWNYFFFVP